MKLPVAIALLIVPIVALCTASAAETNADQNASLEAKFANYGTLIVRPFVSASFPHPARADGHKYHDKLYSAQEHYSDSTVAMFIPKNFHPGAKVDFVVHFHGWNNTVAGSLARYKLIEQFCDSGVNAVLIVPEGPHDAPDSFGGKLEDTNGFARFMTESVQVLKSTGPLANTEFSVNRIIVSGHSGGYHVMAALLDHGGMSDKIAEAWLFDALYGGTENYAAWQKRENGRMLNIYTDHGGTKEETEKLMASYKAQQTPFFSTEDGAASETESALRDNKLVFIHTDLPHDEVVAKRQAFCEFLKTSCLKHE